MGKNSKNHIILNGDKLPNSSLYDHVKHLHISHSSCKCVFSCPDWCKLVGFSKKYINWIFMQFLLLTLSGLYLQHSIHQKLHISHIHIVYGVDVPFDTLIGVWLSVLKRISKMSDTFSVGVACPRRGFPFRSRSNML